MVVLVKISDLICSAVFPVNCCCAASLLMVMFLVLMPLRVMLCWLYSLAAYNHLLDRTAEIVMSCDNKPKQSAISLPITIEPMIRYRLNDELMSQPVHARLNQKKTEIESINDAIFYQQLSSLKHLTLEVLGINGQTYRFKFDLKEFLKIKKQLGTQCANPIR
ncbi:hypothetical protein E2B99_10115 [Alkanindiges illinoisensis]|uniref:Uncharacterized protein n=1 Tax=Alkanindiges illinoisensis TaxID=197183 RepID=A0A4Y7XAW3_9GAMM|nr:hypothetical protein E2B99_10115 [Alkanindiges illinoisensis]